MICQTIYKDANGKPSAIYQRALEKYGPEKAEEIYIRHMMSTIDTRFSESTMGNNAEIRAEEVEINADHSSYINKITKVEYDPVTSILSDITGSKRIEGIETLLGKQDQFKEAKKALAKQQIYINLTEQQKAAGITDADKAIGQDPTLLSKAEADIQSMWNAQNEGGNEFHEIFAEVIRQWQAAVDQNDADRKLNATITPIDLKDINGLVESAKQELDDKKLWYREGYQEKISKDNIQAFARKFFEYVLKQEKIHGRLVLKPEFKIWTENYKAPNSNKSGLAGTLDVLMATRDNSFNQTIDFKTKIANKVPDFDNPTGRFMNFPFNLDDSPRNQSLGQQLFYTAILGTKDYNIPVSKIATFVVPMTFDRIDRNAKLGENKYIVGNITSGVEIFEDNVGSESLHLVKKFLKGDDGKKLYEDARIKGIAGITEKWSGESEDGTPNATYTKYWKKQAIEKSLLKKRNNEKGVPIVTLGVYSTTPIEVPGMTDTQIREMLDKKYDEAKEIQQKISYDIVSVFNDPTARIPKSLNNKQDGVTALLQGISKETHTLRVLQDLGEEFEGIGPDVLIAEDKITHAVTLLSAVTTSRHKVNFKSDGSKTKRTSLLGNYQTDDAIESRSLNQSLMTEANTHNFLSLKLGLAALYLRKNRTSRLNLDQMRVVSLGFGDSYQLTPTTFEEEIGKLKMFQRYAGADFPMEYRELLKQVDDEDYVAATGQHLANIMKQIETNDDPLGKQYNLKEKKELLAAYNANQTGALNGYELKQMLGNYLQWVATKIHHEVGNPDMIIRDKRFVAASKAFLELMKFQNDLGKLAAERNSVQQINGAVSSGDSIQVRLHVLYNEASAAIRSDMENYFSEHKQVSNTLQRYRSVDWVGNTTKMFKHLYRDSTNPEERMMLKDENDVSLSKEEKAYIKFFNDNVINGLIRVSPKRLHEGIRNGTLWKRGTVPTIRGYSELITKENFKSWKNLKNAVVDTFKKSQKDTSSHTKNFLNFGFKTQFDNQAQDQSHGHSEVRRRMLGITDLNAVTDPDPNIETNLALILNMVQLEAAEKVHYTVLIQSIVASHSMLASLGDRQRTNMSDEMINAWREAIIFNRYKDEPIAPYLDPINKFSSAMLFNYSLRQAMIEFSTGTLQTTSSLISNSVQNAIASIIGQPEHGGRYNMSDFNWGVRAWDAAFHISGEGDKVRKIMWDLGMLVADADDMRGAEFEGGNKFDTFKSDAGFALNKLFFNSAITHTTLAQVKHMGIADAYVKQGDTWVYDETLDPRYFAYDPVNKIGEKPPVTDDEKQRYSVWTAARKVLSDEGMIDLKTMRMKTPMTANERAEIKHYATRTFGSFNKDSWVNFESWVVGRSMLRYKKWAMQKIANWHTPTVKNDMWGHWVTTPDGKGGYNTQWVADEFQGILQTVGFLIQEVGSLRGQSALKNLNRYQRENLAKLLSDLVLVLIMLLLALPLLANTTEEVSPTTGKVTNVAGEFGKSVTGISAYKAAMNATADLFFISNLVGIGSGPSAGGITSSIFPGFGTSFTMATKAWKAVSESMKPDGTPMVQWNALLNSVGAGRTISMGAEIITK
jgi:hypothetical protein